MDKWIEAGGVESRYFDQEAQYYKRICVWREVGKKGVD